MTLFKFACPKCQHRFMVQLPEGAERGKVTCPQCQTSVIVRAPAAPQGPAHQASPSPPPAPPSTSETPSTFPAGPVTQPMPSPGEGVFPADLLYDVQMNPQSTTSDDATIPAALQPYAPPTAAVSVAAGQACPLCGRSDKNYLVRGKTLFEHKVCRTCSISFLNRRQVAFIIDIVIFYVVSYSIFAGGFVIGFMMVSNGGEVAEEQLAGIEMMFTVINVVLFVFWFLLKDGFSGASPGKAVMGIRVIDENTGYPIGFSGSVKRNWPIVLLGFVPFAWLIIGGTMGKGYRIGDRGARTKVIWKKYQYNPVFRSRRMASLATGVPSPA